MTRAAACGVAIALLALGGCDSGAPSYQGWVEADLIFVAPDDVGRVETLTVKEGDRVKTGELLFTLDADIQKADLAQIQAALTNAQQSYDRASMLLKTGAGTQKDYDAAEATLRDAKARFNSAQTRLARRRVFSPVDGTVEQIYCRAGEMALADRPVVALLPPENLKIRFFVPQAALPALAYGDTVEVNCDGCGRGLTARVSFMARQSEFTPPVIYSLSERQKLVFLIEARPETPGAFRVGQPVDVTLARRAVSVSQDKPQPDPPR